MKNEKKKKKNKKKEEKENPEVAMWASLHSEARSVYWELSRNRSTPICCPEQSRASFL